MRLTSFTLHEAPGIPRGFALADLDRELVVVHGPNGVGKSTLCRAVRATLWPEEGARLRGESRWRGGGSEWFAALEGGAVRWQRDGQDLAAPPRGLPEAVLAPCYLLSLRDLLPADGATEQALAARLRREMAGGFDLEEARKVCAKETSLSRTLAQGLRKAREALREVEKGFRELAAEEGKLQRLEEEVRRLEALAREERALEQARERLDVQAAVAALKTRQAEFPAGMDRLHGHELRRLETLEGDIRRLEKERAGLELKRREAVAAAAATGLEEPLSGETLGRLEALQQDLAQAAQELRAGSRDREEVLARLRRGMAALRVAEPEENLQAPDPETADDLDRLLAEARGLATLAETAGPGRGAGPAPWLLPALLAMVVLAGGAGLLWGWLAVLPVVAVAGALVLAGRRHPDRAERDLGARACRVERDFRSLAERLGLDPEAEWARSPLAVANWADHLRGLLDARRDLDAVAARLEAAMRRQHQVLVRIGEELGLAEALADDVAARAAIRDRRERSERLARARERLAAAERELAGLARALAAARRQVEEIYQEAGIPAGEDRRAEFVRRLGLRQAWQELQDELRAGKRRAKELAGALADHPGFLELDAGALASRLAEARAAAGALGERHQELGRLRDRLERAREGRSFEEAFARLARAREELQEHLAAFLRSLAAAFLLDEVEREHQERTRPQALQEAGRLLAAFTGGACELDLPAAGGGNFRARDTASGRGLSLAELSDGTRIQLLLAVRVGYLLAHEGGGEAMPLFLDEALGTSDPRRFRAVGAALLELAAAGRQVFYLTADPADVRAWQRLCAECQRPDPALVDLAEARGLAGAWDPEATPPMPPPPPDPKLPPEDFVRALGVARPDGWQEATALDLYHLLAEDQALVARLAAAGIRQVGPWLTLGESARERVVGSPAQRITARCQVAAALWPLWRQGRARPVDLGRLAEAVKENGRPLLTPGTRDAVLGRLRELGGDAERFLAEALEIDGLGHKKHQELVDWFAAEGYLADGEPLPEAECIARVHERVAACGAGTLEPAEVPSLVRRLLLLLG